VPLRHMAMHSVTQLELNRSVQICNTPLCLLRCVRGVILCAVLCYVQAEHKIQSADGPLLLQLQKVRWAATRLAHLQQGRAQRVMAWQV
jgi:hypothetical protein